MHPSYRDLIIDELVSDNELRIQFLENMSVKGIKLAISDTGGEKGYRRLPLMIDSNSWDMLRSRCIQIIEDLEQEDATDLLTVLTAALWAAQEDEIHQLESTLQAVCCGLKEKWDSQATVLCATAIRRYCHASELLTPLPPLPSFEHTWVATYDEFQDALNNAKNGAKINAWKLESWTDLLDAVKHSEPRFLRGIRFPQNYGEDISELLGFVRREVRDKPEDEDLTLSEFKELHDRFETLRSCLEVLRGFDGDWKDHLRNLLEYLEFAIQELENAISEREESDDDDNDYYGSSDQGDEFDIGDLFSDL